MRKSKKIVHKRKKTFSNTPSNTKVSEFKKCLSVMKGVKLLNLNHKNYEELNAPLVSIIVPVYNSEKFLEKNVNSYLRQTFRDFELIIVNDGSVDKSKNIAYEFLEKDVRIRYVGKENGGLSSARNAGVHFARGRYLFFIDPDDTMENSTIEKMVDKALSTNSDIVIAGYNLQIGNKFVKPGIWMQELFAKEYTKTTIIENPELLQAAVAWGKLYKSKFYHENNLAFIDGILYEDQPFTSKAFSLAKNGIDSIGGSYIHWLQHDASISHQVNEKDLAARLDSAQITLNNLLGENLNEVYQNRLTQYLNHDFRQSLRNFGRINDNFDKILIERIPFFYNQLSDKERIDGIIEPVYQLLMNQEVDALKLFVFDNEIKAQKSKIVNYKGNAICDWSPYGYISKTLKGTNKISSEYIDVYSRILEYTTTKEKVLFDFQAYLTHLAPSEFDYEISISLIENQTNNEVYNVLAKKAPSRTDLIRESNDWFSDFSKAIYSFSVPVQLLQLGKKYQIVLKIKAGNYAFEKRLNTLKGETNTSYRVSPISSTRRIRLLQDNEGLFIKQSAVVELKKAFLKKNKMYLLLFTGSNIKSAYLNTFDKQDNKLFFKISKIFRNHYLAVVEINQVKKLSSNWLKLRLVNSKNVNLRTHIVKSSRIELSNGYCFTNTPSGDLELSTAKTLFVESVEVANDVLKTKIYLKNSIQKNNVIIARLETKGRTFDYKFEVQNNSTRILEIPLVYQEFGKYKKLPISEYILTIWGDEKNWKTKQKSRLKFEESCIKHLPQNYYENGILNYQIRYSYMKNRIIVQKFNKIPDHEKGGFGWGNLLMGYRNSVHPINEKTFLLTTYYGETATDNALAIWEYVDKHPELGINCIWAVKDENTSIPKGAKSVIINSQEWFKALSTAEYLIENVHQTAIIRKKIGQKIIENFHGYPYKLMGKPYYIENGYSQQRIKSFEIRENEWDYILSPARYATSLYQEAFNFSGKYIESGHPRNDILVSEEFEEQRLKINLSVRENLGISLDKKVILYAPTYRETKSLNEFSAKMVNFFDLEKFGKYLGDDYIILVRGHMMNRRAGYSYNGESNIVDVTQYSEIRDLIIASNLAILDYSSLRFDYSQTKKPMIFYVPDIEEYENNREGLMDYSSTAPGPVVKEFYDLLEEVHNHENYWKNFGEKWQKFHDTYTELDDGKATERYINSLLSMNEITVE